MPGVSSLSPKLCQGWAVLDINSFIAGLGIVYVILGRLYTHPIQEYYGLVPDPAKYI